MQLDPPAVDLWVFAAIAGMAVATYFTRFIGYWLVRHRTVGGRLAGALEAVPGAVLTSIIAPMALATGPAETAAAIVTVLLALRLPLVVAVGGGCIAVVVLRALLA